MTMDRRRIMLWGLLVFSTLFTAYQYMSGNARRTVAPAAQQPGAQQAAQPPADAVVVTSTSPAVPVEPLPPADLSAWRAGLGARQRDPFFTADELAAMGRPVVEGPAPLSAPVALPSYTVKVVLMEGSEGRALIDNQVVQVGDRLGNEVVAEILPDSVVLENGTARRRLQVAGKKPIQITLERNR